MALRRSRVRIPLGPQYSMSNLSLAYNKSYSRSSKSSRQRVGRLRCEPSNSVYGTLHPLKGYKTELACCLARGTSLVNRVVSDGFNRYLD